MMAPSKPARTTCGSTILTSMKPISKGLCNFCPGNKKREEIEGRGPDDCSERTENPCSDDRRDRVRRVVKAVDEIKRQCDGDDK